jgi:hypothetical protein
MERIKTILEFFLPLFPFGASLYSIYRGICNVKFADDWRGLIYFYCGIGGVLFAGYLLLVFRERM